MLTGKQRRKLRALGHALEPVVQIGKEGITEGVTAAISSALAAHELVKVKLGQSAPEGRHDAAGLLAERTGGELIQVLGKVVLLYRPDPEQPKIEI